MNRNEKINNIINYLRQAEIKTYEVTPDYLKQYISAIHPFYEYKVRKSESCFIPSYFEIIDCIFSQRTCENFFSEINNALDNLYKFYNEVGNYEAIYLTNKINLLIEKSFKVIKIMYNIFNLKFDIEKFKFSNILYNSFVIL